ncbi:STAS domain-containing protein [Chitinimonas sp. BJYL2]|uniref:STAS domain-containing protein n=1 Tax=Chitinimonas sp. BJYL2 TaxID=2976696 RepID=UPI0022B4D0F7|nr:STAS domain-containing protein [Chitinimonas sp. BJYL2]
MVFSFFKKKDAEADLPMPPTPRLVKPKPIAPATGEGPETAPPAAVAATDDEPVKREDLPALDFTTIGPSTLSAPQIEVAESSDVLSPAMEQAAIAFANDQIDDAIAILAADIQDAHGRHALDTWLMLFDLYQMRNRHAEFDELALQFVVAFERSAPVWRDVDADKKPAPAPAAKAGGPYFLFPSKLAASDIEASLDQLEKHLAAGVAVRVDFGRIEELDSGSAQAIVARWAKFKKKKAKFQPSGGPALAEKLKARIEVMRRVDDEAPFWLLLLEIYQLLGLHDDFENTAVDYAVTYEVSPPSWDANAKTKTVAEVAAEEAKLRAEAPPAELVQDAYRFEGVIVSATEATFAPLFAYADKHNEVRVDFSHVPRVDFVSAGMLMNTVVALTAQSKQVTLVGANELIVALFRIMGINEVASIVRRK